MEKIFYINRPLVFLCGPYHDLENKYDRRTMLLNSICDLSRKHNGIEYFKVIPIIVDHLFEPAFVKNNKLKYKVIEEIVANISFKTYIFLDTMSTGYELGLFDNSTDDLKPVSLLETNYKSRKKNYIGQYVKLSLGEERFVVYEGKRNLRGYSVFKNKKTMPETIENTIKKDEGEIYSSLKKGFKLEFSNSNINNNHLGFINYFYNDRENQLFFNVGIKTMFYYLTVAYNTKQIKEYCNKNNYIGLYKKIINDLFVHFLNSTESDKLGKSFLVYNNPKIFLNIGNLLSSKEMLKYLSLIITSINNDIFHRKYCGKTINTTRPIRPYYRIFKTISKDFLYDFVHLTNIEKTVIKNYTKIEDSCSENITIKISGKNRTLHKYSSSSNGNTLQNIHTKLNEALNKAYKSNLSSFAYKKGCSTIDCINQHIENSTFLKLDIHHFFESIDYEILYEKLHLTIKKKCSNLFDRYFPSINKTRDFFRVLTYKNKIPLGFITSPVISDFYLNKFDDEMNKILDGCIYTRYADDILISSKNCFSKEPLVSMISDNISKLNLELNMKKQHFAILKNPGDSIRFLGINLVYKGKDNELTISKNDLVSFANKINGYLKNPDVYSSCKTLSTACYIRNVSEKSYSKLIRILNVRFGLSESDLYL